MIAEKNFFLYDHHETGKKTAELPPLPNVNLSINQTNASEATSTSINITITADSPVSGNQTIGLSVSGSGITTGDYYLTKTTVTILSGQTIGTSLLVIADDGVAESMEQLTISMNNFSAGVVSGNNASAVINIENNDCSFVNYLSTFASSFGAEISTFDAASQQVYTVAGEVIERLTLNNSGILSLSGSVTPGFVTPAGFTAIPNSVASKNGIVAASFAIKNNTTSAQDSGPVAFYNAADASFLHSVRVGFLPDMVTFSPNGQFVLTANEGEPNSYGQANSFDPEGSVSIIDISGGVLSAQVTTASFTAFNGQLATLKAAGVRIYGPGATVAQDMEPEYIAFSHDGNTAMVTLQENNAFAKLDMATKTISQIIPMGLKDHSIVGKGLDASDRDSTSSIGKINIKTWPVKGMYEPDAIASFFYNGQDYYFTANEGDARDYTGYAEEIRVGASGYVLDPTLFPTAATLKNNANLGRLQLTKATGDLDNDTDYDEIHAMGARSFTVWNASGSLVYDSGDQLEQITAAKSPSLFNTEGLSSQFDTRSDNKGPEPEGVVVGIVNDKPYVFVGLERTGDVMVYDISNPALPQFVQYINTPQDLAVEGLLFVPANQSPTGKALLITTAEVSKTVTAYELGSNQQAYYTDEDGDGFGTGDVVFIDCGPMEGFANETGDCDDNNSNIYPDAEEICDNADNNCNQQIDEGCGCTNETAHNYDPNATKDDGTCMTCFDNAQNGTETGIDCGGSLCAPCVPPVAVCGNIVTVYANSGNLAYNGPNTADVYLIPALDLDAGSSYSGQLIRTVARTLTSVGFNWTNQGACIDATPNNVYNNIDKGLVHKNCLPVTPADFNKIRNFEMKIADGNGNSTCTGRYIVVNGYPAPTSSETGGISPEATSRASESDESLTLYPNPGNGLLNAILPISFVSERTTITIYNAMGLQVYQIKEISIPFVSVDTNPMTSGVYFVYVSLDGETLIKKWVKM
ncbi:MAG: choice-of-anchor I family protein [Saprospiraceae bacterium]|nr:choice-of-anchor I family protein [Saprospiraceae bacterium]